MGILQNDVAHGVVISENEVGTSSTSDPPGVDGADAKSYWTFGSIGSPILFAPGSYSIFVGWFYSVTNNGDTAWVSLLINDALPPAGADIFTLGRAGSAMSRSVILTDQVFTVTTPLFFDFRFALESGPGGVTMERMDFLALRTR